MLNVDPVAIIVGVIRRIRSIIPELKTPLPSITSKLKGIVTFQEESDVTTHDIYN